jgi:hypothetical protein
MTITSLTNLVSNYFEYIETLSIISALIFSISISNGGFFQRYLIPVFTVFPGCHFLFYGFKYEGIPNNAFLAIILYPILWGFLTYFISML